MYTVGNLVRKRVEQIIVENKMLRAGFAAFPYLVMKEKMLSVGARLTYAFLLMYAWQEGSCFPGQVMLAQSMGVSGRQVQRYLYELRDAAYIKIERRDKRGPNTYILLDKHPTKLKRAKQKHAMQART
jgi:hypothetical protein